MINSMAMVKLNLVMETLTKVNAKIIYITDKVYSLFITEIYIKDNFKMEKSMDKANFYGLMEENMKANG